MPFKYNTMQCSKGPGQVCPHMLHVQEMIAPAGAEYRKQSRRCVHCIAVHDPYDGITLEHEVAAYCASDGWANVSLPPCTAGVEDVDVAVKAARKAFDEGPWPRMGGKVGWTG